MPGPISAGTWRVVIGKAKVVSSPAVYHLEIILRDSAYLQEREADFRNRHHVTKHAPAQPLYTGEDAERKRDARERDAILELAYERGLLSRDTPLTDPKVVEAYLGTGGMARK